MSRARSFYLGPRFAFHHKDKLMACDACVFGEGKHSCGIANAKPRAQKARQRQRTKAISK